MKLIFTKTSLNADKLANEIAQALPNSQFQNIETDWSKQENNLKVAFESELSELDQVILTDIINNHTI